MRQSPTIIQFQMNIDNLDLMDEEKFSNIFNIFCSRDAIKIIFMAEWGTTIKEIERKTECRRSTVYRLVNKLKYLNLITQDESKKIFLTFLGKIFKKQLTAIANIGLISNMLHEPYWENHLINFPEQFLPYIYVFHDAEVIENTKINDHDIILKKTMEIASNGKYFYGIVSGISESHVKIVERIIKEGKEVKIIASNKVKKIIAEDKFFYEKVCELKKYKNGKLIFSDKVDKFTLFFTDRDVMLLLFKKDGKIEWNECLYSKNIQALNFSKEIFKFYETEAKETE